MSDDEPRREVPSLVAEFAKLTAKGGGPTWSKDWRRLYAQMSLEHMVNDRWKHTLRPIPIPPAPPLGATGDAATAAWRKRSWACSVNRSNLAQLVYAFQMFDELAEGRSSNTIRDLKLEYGQAWSVVEWPSHEMDRFATEAFIGRHAPTLDEMDGRGNIGRS